MYHDESGVSVIIGTLMLILITITAASGFALMVSGMQKDAMERESHLAAVESENLRIISIDLAGNSTQWNSVNVTLMNLNTEDSRITAISLNGVHARNYRAKDASGNLDYYRGYPVVYNFNKRVVIPAAGSKEICLNFAEIIINTSDTSEEIDVSDWEDNSSDYLFTPLNRPYTRAMYPNVNYSTVEIYNNSASGLLVNESGNYSVDYDSGTITLLVDGNMTNTSYYIYNCTITQFDTFTLPLPVSKNEPLTIEVITSLINIFKRTFVPPVPLAEVQVRSEWISSDKTRDYLLLDASESFDTGGYVVGFNWSINCSGVGYPRYQTGIQVRANITSSTNSSNYDTGPFYIDLDVIDDTRMIANLAQQSGEIYIPENQNFNNS